MSEEKFVRTICIDFDGVLHSYFSGWRGVDKIPDPPVKGAIEWLKDLLYEEGIKPVIYSSRSKDPNGIAAMRLWLELNGLSKEEIERLEFPTQKPSAFLTIDDRAICFEGYFPSAEKIKRFKPWYRDNIPQKVVAKREAINAVLQVTLTSFRKYLELEKINTLTFSKEVRIVEELLNTACERFSSFTEREREKYFKGEKNYES